MPPVPSRVNKRISGRENRVQISFTSCSRPINDVRVVGIFHIGSGRGISHAVCCGFCDPAEGPDVETATGSSEEKRSCTGIMGACSSKPSSCAFLPKRTHSFWREYGLWEAVPRSQQLR